MKKFKEDEIRIYLLGFITIIASWMIAIWQAIIEKLELSLDELQIILLFDIGAFFLLLSFWIDPSQQITEKMIKLNKLSISSIIIMIISTFWFLLLFFSYPLILALMVILLSFINIFVIFLILFFYKKEYKFVFFLILIDIIFIIFLLCFIKLNNI